MMNDIELVRLQINLEYQVDHRGRLIPRAGSTERARFIVYSLQNGYLTFFREDVPEAISSQLQAMPGEALIKEHNVVKGILSKLAPSAAVCAGTSYVFVSLPAPKSFEGVIEDGGRFVIIRDGRPVSWAFSAACSPRRG